MTTTLSLILNGIGIIGIIASAVLLFLARKKVAHAQFLLDESQDKLKNAKREIENEKRSTSQSKR